MTDNDKNLTILGLSTTTNLMKMSASGCKNDGKPKMTKLAAKQL